MGRTGAAATEREAERGLTRRWCAGLLAARRTGLPPQVLARARQDAAGVAGRAVAGSGTAAVEAILATAARLGPHGDVPVPGRRERLAASWACLAVGSAARVGGDDPHTAPFAALLPLAVPHARRADDVTLTAAFALGVEAQLRVARAMSPWHHEEGWDVASTAGVLGAAVAAGVAIGLDEAGLEEAVGIAASTTLGTREGAGTMVEPFHAGKAAANGWLAAQLAAHGFTGSRDVLAAPRGYLAVLSPHGSAPERLTEGLGEEWALLAVAPAPSPAPAAADVTAAGTDDGPAWWASSASRPGGATEGTTA
ncbi:MmgE/PrpD family protein [Streptomyces sp. 4N509B]|uniref:MmgE/PrpD family protein n=1 Tax=Streptomyces sp. 4N509B TaxID=3457413 RepID=UPI003FD294E9